MLYEEAPACFTNRIRDQRCQIELSAITGSQFCHVDALRLHIIAHTCLAHADGPGLITVVQCCGLCGGLKVSQQTLHIQEKKGRERF